MLDLKILEKMLDDALAKETKESLTNFLKEKRKKNNKKIIFTKKHINK